MTKDQILKLNLLVLTMFFSDKTFGDSEKIINSLEITISEIDDQLKNDETKLRNLLESALSQGKSSRLLIAEQFLNDGLTFLEQEDCINAISSLNLFLKMSSGSGTEEKLIAMLRLADCHLLLSQDKKAFSSYSQYIRTVSTSSIKNFSHVIHAIKSALFLAEKKNYESLYNLMSGLVNLEFPPRFQGQLLYYLGKNAFLAGKKLLARRWLEQVIYLPTDRSFQDKSLYILALIEINEDRLDQASKKLQSLKPYPGKPNDPIHDIALLGLARIHVKKDLPKTALGYLMKIKKDSVWYSKAVFEKVFLQLALKNPKSALETSLFYLNRFKNDNDYLRIKQIIPILSLKSGKIEKTKSILNERIKKIEKILRWVRSSLGNKGRIKFSDLLMLHDNTRGLISPSPTTSLAIELFSNLGSLQKKQRSSDAAIRQLTYTLGRGQMQQFYPKMYSTLKSLESLAHTTGLKGHQLVSHSRNELEVFFQSRELVPLDRSIAKRIQLKNSPLELEGMVSNWQNYLNYSKIQNKLGKIFRLLKSNQAVYQGNRFASKNKDNILWNERLERQGKELSRLTDNYRKLLQLTKKAKIASSAFLFPINRYKRFYINYFSLIDSELQMLETLLLSSSIPKESQLRLRFVIMQWRRNASSIFENYKNIIDLTKKYISQILDKISAHESMSRSLDEEIAYKLDELEEFLGSNRHKIFFYYEHNLEERLAKLKKWHGDLAYLKFKVSEEAKTRTLSTMELEKQMLNDDLLNIETGVKLKW